MKIQTHLISGAGNTFHIVSERAETVSVGSAGSTNNWTLERKKSFAKKICEIQPADGFIYLKNGSPPFFNLAWNFYNNDGSDAEMCGNATRCVGLYVSQILGDAQNSWTLNTAAGPIVIEKVFADQFKVVMTPIQIFKSDRGFYCDTGVPHFIQEIVDFKNYREHKKEAAKLRADAEFQPRGTNVTYVQLLPDIKQVKAVSYERGVEDFTDACGTGAMAAAAYNLMKRGSDQTQVEMPGGTLMMDLADLQHPVMIGPATLLGKYEYEDSI